MAKKHSVSSTHILIDIPIGSHGSKVKSRSEALRLKRSFETIGKKLRKRVKVILTDGSQPIGNGIGPALEARDVLWILTRDGRRPLDLEQKCIMMAAEIFKLAGIKNGRKKAVDLLESGRAHRKMREIIRAQNGSIFEPDKIRIGQFRHDVAATKSGNITAISNTSISRLARIAGAPVDKGAGVYLYKHIKDKVKKGEKLFTIYAESKEKMEYAVEVGKKANAYIIG